MKVRKVLCLLLVAMVATLTLVSCNNEVVQESASVSFIPSSAKALNQSGQTTTLTLDVSAYYWEYYCKQVTTTSAVDLESLEIDYTKDSPNWVAFKKSTALTEDVEKGLGVIPDLIKGGKYVFGLRGWNSKEEKASSTGQVIWQGFQYVNSGTSDELDKTKLMPTELKTKTTLVTVDVFSVGNGRLFFNITAPNSANWVESYTREVQTGTGDAKTVTTETVNTPKNRFVYIYQALGSTTLEDATVKGGEHYLQPEYTSSTDCFVYYDTKSPVLPAAGTYLFTIWQEYWDEDNTGDANGMVWDATNNVWKDATSDNPDKYTQSDERKQVVIVNIVPGVDTVIAGTLDSTSIETIDYNANGYTDENAYGLLVRFHSADAGKVDEMTATVYRVLANTGNTLAVNEDNKYVSATLAHDDGTNNNHIIRLDDPTVDKNKIDSAVNYKAYVTDRKQYDGDSAIITWTSNTDMELAFYINGDKMAYDSTEKKFITDCDDYIFLESEIDGLSESERDDQIYDGTLRATSYVKYDATNNWFICETKPINSKSTAYKYFAYIVSIKANKIDENRASEEESVCFTITNNYVAVTSITIQCNGEDVPDAGITLSSTAKAQVVDNGWSTAIGSVPTINYYATDANGNATGDAFTNESSLVAVNGNATTYVAKITAPDNSTSVSLLLEVPASSN